VAADERPAGGLFAIAPDGDVRPIAVEGIEEIRPHGLSTFRDGDTLTVATVSSGPDGDEVLVLDGPAPGAGDSIVRLTVRARVSDPLLRTVNDIVLTGPRTFYATNDHGARGRVQAALERYLAVPWGNIVFWDGDAARVVARRLAFPNGIALVDDSIIVSETLGRGLLVFDPDPNGELHRERTIGLGFGPDNLSVTGAGGLLVTGHQDLLALDRRARDRSVLSPSAVAVVDVAGDRRTVVLADDGAEVSSASVAVVQGETLLLGNVYEDAVVRCHLDAAGRERLTGPP
jgi:arylesterase/paraoxonase